MSEKKPSPNRVASRALGIPMTKTAGEVRFIKDRGGDEKNFGWSGTGPSQREINKGFEFSPAKLKPLAKTLRSTLMALGHVQSAYHDFTKIKSAMISPDGSLGGKGYIQEIREMRRQYMNVSEALSALSDTIYDEINAPHWAVKAGEEQATTRTREDVAEIMDDVEEIRENPEEAADEMEEKWENEPGHAKTAARRPAKLDREWWAKNERSFMNKLKGAERLNLERDYDKVLKVVYELERLADDYGWPNKRLEDRVENLSDKASDMYSMSEDYMNHYLASTKTAMDSDQRDLYDTLKLVAENDGRAYKARKPTDAIDRAFKDHKKTTMDDLEHDFKAVRKQLVKDLQIQWRRKKADASRVADIYRRGR